MKEEIWKDVPGYEGKYQASTLGRVRSVDRVIRLKSRGGTYYDYHKKGRILRPGKYCESGHVSVVLGHKAPSTPVHHIIAITFIGPRPDGADVCHANGDPTDNRLENLRYDTRTENILDVYRVGKVWRRLTLEQIHEIRDTPRTVRGVDIARKYGIAQSTVSAIRCGRYKTCHI